MLTFNDLLRRGGLELSGARLLRHTHPDRATHRHLYDDGVGGHPAFETFQSIQGATATVQQFDSAKFIAAFVAAPFVTDPACRTAFAGVWRMHGRRATPRDDAYGYKTNAASVAYRMTRIDAFDPLRGRLFVDWGASTRAWIQRADNQDKPISALLPAITEAPFPGYLQFRRRVTELELLPGAWTTALRIARGVYLVTDTRRDRFYVGSASGNDGFFGRWMEYANGHAGNLGLVAAKTRVEDLEVAVLEVVGSAATKPEIDARESAWKEKLGTRAGRHLNLN